MRLYSAPAKRGVSMQVRRRWLESFDGTRLACYGAGDPKGPPLVLCGGLGGGVDIWRSLIERLAPRYRIISWDYRGLYRSSPAAEPSAYSLPHHARDLLELLKHEGIESPVLVGWSMGVQVALEVHRVRPNLASGLVLLHGTAGNPLDTAFDTRLSARVSPLVLGLLRLVGTGFSGIGPQLTRMPPVVSAFVWSSQQLGLMAPQIDVSRFRDMAEEWTGLHLGVYADIFRELSRHDASDLLEQIQAPTLVVAGGADRFTPRHAAERMVEAMPDAELELVPGATHFGLLEFPEPITQRVESFLRRRLAGRPTRSRRTRVREGRAKAEPELAPSSRD